MSLAARRPSPPRAAGDRTLEHASGSRVALAALCSLVLAIAAPLAAQEDVKTEFWPQIDTFLRLNDSMRLYVPIARTREGTENSDQYGTVGAYLDYFVAPIASLHLVGPAFAAQMRRLQLRVGYGYTEAGNGQPASNTMTAEATARMVLPWEILASDRNRFDLRFSGGDFDPRYRNRVQLERNAVLGQTTLTPYASGEFFYDFNNGDWFKIRVTGGLEVHLSERVVAEAYFQRNFVKDSTDVNGIGLVLKLYLR